MTKLISTLEIQQLRRQRMADWNAAAIKMITESCFLSPERARHLFCEERAAEIIGDDPTEEAMLEYESFFAKFWCSGAAVACTNCGILIPPGENKCADCGNKIELVPALLSQPEWHKAVVSRGIHDLATALGGLTRYFSGFLFAAARIMVTQGWIDVGRPDAVVELRETLHDMLVDPDKQAWHYKWASACSYFWVQVWPWLEQQGFSLADTDALSTEQVEEAVRKYRQATRTSGNMEEIASNVALVLKEGGNPRNVALDGDPVETTVCFTDRDLLAAGVICDTEVGPYVIAPIREEWLEIAKERYSWQDILPDDLLEMLGAK